MGDYSNLPLLHKSYLLIGGNDSPFLKRQEPCNRHSLVPGSDCGMRADGVFPGSHGEDKEVSAAHLAVQHTTVYIPVLLWNRQNLK